MKFNQKIESAAFKPVTVSITLETQEELDCIRNLLIWTESIPTLGGTEKGSKTYNIRQEFVDGLRKALTGTF